jgi:hypothetical protein
MVKATKKIVKKAKVSKKGKKVTKDVPLILPKEWGNVTLKKDVKVKKFNATQELLSVDNLEKSVKECLKNKDYKGVVEMIDIYKQAISKADVKLKPEYEKSPFVDELLHYCEDNPPCHIVDSGDGWAIVCKIVDLDVRVTRKGNNPFQDYSSENNSYHKVKGAYGVMAVISWDKNNPLLNNKGSFWDSFPDVYEVEAPGQITYWLDKLGKG